MRKGTGNLVDPQTRELEMMYIGIYMKYEVKCDNPEPGTCIRSNTNEARHWQVRLRVRRARNNQNKSEINLE